MLKPWQRISIPVDEACSGRLQYWEDPTLEEKMEAYLKQHVLVLHVTEQNPLPTKDIQFTLRYIERNLFRVKLFDRGELRSPETPTLILSPLAALWRSLPRPSRWPTHPTETTFASTSNATKN